MAETQSACLSVLAQKYGLTASMTLGLGAGLYFEYFRTPHRTPTRFITGLQRSLESNLDERVSMYQVDPMGTMRAALRENALWFNLDRAPTNGLLGMEMLAEELPQFGTLADGKECADGIAAAIRETDGLYRQTYAAFLAECAPSLLGSAVLADELTEIATEWNVLAERLAHSAGEPAQYELAGRMLRRLAMREEHFWGSILEM